MKKLIGKILCLIGIHDWRYVKQLEDTKLSYCPSAPPARLKMRLCRRCPKQQWYDPR